MTDNPWRERNLEQIAEARRVLAEARADRHPDNDDETSPAESEDP